ncbi:arginine/agmatine antiporter [Halomonas sp. AOP43-A1-21]
MTDQTAVATKKKMGVVPATLLVAGNMMGSGIFMLPANLSAIGSIALLGWLFTTVGAVALALVFAKLASIDPAEGGPYAYTRKAFGDYMGYQTNMIYWLANVIGNVALAVAGLGYLSHFFPSLQTPLVLAFGSIAVIWFFTYANILGPHVVGRLQSFTTIFALVPIFGMAFFGWFWFNPDTFTSAWNVSDKGSIGAVMATFTFTLWAFIGVESASVSAGVVENPSRNVPIATVGGVILASIAYILSSSVIMGMIPNKELITSAAPFADAARVALGDFAGSAVALAAAIGCLGSLAGWTLLTGQTAKAAADDGLFPGIFSRVNKRGVPSLGLMIIAALMSAQVLATVSPTASEQFGKIASVAVIMTLLPYIYSMISIKVLGYGKMPHGQYTFFVSAGLLAAIYCMIALVGSDGGQTRWALIFVIATIVFYSVAVTRKRDIDEKHLHPGGVSPVWVRYLALGVTLTALVVMFYLSVGQYSRGDMRSRSVAPPDAPAAVERMVPEDRR